MLFCCTIFFKDSLELDAICSNTVYYIIQTNRSKSIGRLRNRKQAMFRWSENSTDSSTLKYEDKETRQSEEIKISCTIRVDNISHDTLSDYLANCECELESLCNVCWRAGIRNTWVLCNGVNLGECVLGVCSLWWPCLYAVRDLGKWSLALMWQYCNWQRRKNKRDLLLESAFSIPPNFSR